MAVEEVAAAAVEAKDAVVPKGKCILVGVQMDNEGRELLAWAVGKVAEPGDRVVAVHVYRKSDTLSVLALTKSLDKYLAEYECLCNLKQVAIVGRLSESSSIKKAIVDEAKLCEAATVVVGMNKATTFRSSASLAKYCSKKLPQQMSLFAIHGGKIVFEKRGADMAQEEEEKITLGSLLHPNITMRSMLATTSSKVGIERFPSVRSVKEAIPTRKKKNTRTLSESDTKLVLSQPLANLMPNLKEHNTGWPLKRTASVIVCPKREPLRTMSVVEWVMTLPERPRESTQVPDNSSASDSDAKGDKYAELRQELDEMIARKSSSCRWYSKAELDNATDNFSPGNLIGNGGTSQVFRGCQSDGSEIAVKVIKLSEDSLKSFLLEADIVTALRHDRIAPLLGINIECDQLISVYNLLAKGSLEDNLHGKKAKQPLRWNLRFKVALGIAEALSYIHNECPLPVIHRDIKSSNILLSDDYEPQLSDFGLAIWAQKNKASTTESDVVGTFGYLAPEYFMYGKVSDKIDVYSFGVVLLELLTGRKPIRTESSKGQESLIMWVTKMLEERELIDLLDPNLEGDYDSGQMQRMILAAKSCIRRIARHRPRMNQVARLLRGEDDIGLWSACVTQVDTEEEIDNNDEAYPPSSVASHLGLALQDVDIDDATSISSMDQSYHNYIEEYLRGRWSRSSSFD